MRRVDNNYRIHTLFGHSNPLVVHPNGMLTGSVPFEGFETSRGRGRGWTEVAEVGGGVEHDELTERTALDVWRDFPALPSPKKPFSLAVGERFNHERVAR